jgi:integrase
MSGAAPTTVNSSVRTREYLTQAEVEQLMTAARAKSRWGHRDATMILIGYRHGLRASELCDLQWSQVEFRTGRLHVRRAKNGSPSVHPLARRRDTRVAAPTTGARGNALRLRLRARRPNDAEGLSCPVREDRCSGQNAIPDPSAHAAPWLRLCAGECGTRHSGAAGLSRP